jgi:hypothetical protein
MRLGSDGVGEEEVSEAWVHHQALKVEGLCHCRVNATSKEAIRRIDFNCFITVSNNSSNIFICYGLSLLEQSLEKKVET